MSGKKLEISKAREERIRQYMPPAKTCPSYSAVSVMYAMDKDKENFDILFLEKAIREKIEKVCDGGMGNVEAMLFGQALSLQSMFSEMSQRAMSQERFNLLEGFMKLALRAQSQCRMTLETLANIKNPPVVFAKQANVTTGPQQINNGAAMPSRAGENGNEQNQLLDDGRNNQH